MAFVLRDLIDTMLKHTSLIFHILNKGMKFFVLGHIGNVTGFLRMLFSAGCT